MNGKEVDIMEASVSEMIVQLRRGKQIQCQKCKKGIYVTNPKYIKTSNSFWCNKCGDLLHVTPGDVIVD